MDTNITMSLPEVKKYDIIKKAINKELNGSQAAGLLNLTTRHIRRLKVKVVKDGIKGLAHGNRGKSGNRRIPEYYQTRYYQTRGVCKLADPAGLILLSHKLLPEKPKKINSGKNNLQWVIPKSTAHVPPADHPWRQINNLAYLKKLTKASK